MEVRAINPTTPQYEAIWHSIEHDLSTVAYGYVCSVIARKLTVENAEFIAAHTPHKDFVKLLPQARNAAKKIHSVRDVERIGLGPYLRKFRDELRGNMRVVAVTISAEAFEDVLLAFMQAAAYVPSSPNAGRRADRDTAREAYENFGRPLDRPRIIRF